MNQRRSEIQIIMDNIDDFALLDRIIMAMGGNGHRRWLRLHAIDGHTQTQIAKREGVSQPYVSTTINALFDEILRGQGYRRWGGGIMTLDQMELPFNE